MWLKGKTDTTFRYQRVSLSSSTITEIPSLSFVWLIYLVHINLRPRINIVLPPSFFLSLIDQKKRRIYITRAAFFSANFWKKKLFPLPAVDELKTITTRGMITNFHRVINARIHLHHSHISGEIIGHVHDFCNWRVRENKIEIPLIGHNFLGFDIFYMVKGYK